MRAGSARNWVAGSSEGSVLTDGSFNRGAPER